MELKFLTIVALCLVLSSLASVQSAKILFMVPIATRSEKHFFEPIIFELGRFGHEVTVVTSSKSSNLPKNVKEIMPSTYQEQFGAYSSLDRKYSIAEFLFVPIEYFTNICHKIYNDEEFQLVTTQQKYDLIFTNFFFAPCFYGLIHKMGVPFILINSFPLGSYQLEDLGTHIPSSILPYSLLHYSDRMSFSERLLNYVVNWVLFAHDKLVMNPALEQVYRQYLGQDLPSVTEIHRNASLVMMNTHFTSTNHRPLMPDVIEIGCIHCKAAEPLPQDLEDFVSNTEHGFIYFSLGTVLTGTSLPNSTQQKFINVFSRLKQKVVWKWESEQLNGVSKNVMLKKWLPQQDLLGHPNIRLFISHAGLLSTQQTIYHGVPTLFFPVFFDQITHAKNAVNNGMGLQLDINNISEEELETSVTRLLTESRFQEDAKTLSSVFHDQMNTPLEKAIFWTNFVLKHKGASQLRSSARNLNIFQFHSIDVILCLLFLTVFNLFAFFYIIRKIIAGLTNLFKTNKTKKE